MPVPSILSLGKAIPPYSLGQNEIAQRVIKRLNMDDEEAWTLERIYRNSAIERRYSVFPDLLLPAEKNRPASGITLGMSARNELYKKEAPLLAARSAKEALENWQRPWEEITHVISVSCTGAITPGLEFKLVQALGLKATVSRLGVNFMGCFGAFKGLSVAHKIACQNPLNRVLVVCTELCTLHFRPGPSLESTVIHSLFADGSSAVVVGCEPRQQERSLFELVQEKCCALPNSENEMTWDASDLGFDMTLSAKVPALIEQNILSFAEELIRGREAIEWPVHPGGKAILEALEKALRINRSQTGSSWNVLSKFGNMSSATFLYVLDDLLHNKARAPWSIGLGFGPGLSIEGLLLRNSHLD